jgi:hypothetical protein
MGSSVLNLACLVARWKQDHLERASFDLRDFTRQAKRPPIFVMKIIRELQIHIF